MAVRGPQKPYIEINWRSFEKLCGIQCTKEEIAHVLNISQSQLLKRVKKEYKMDFSEVHERFRSAGKVSLRRMMWQSAESGNFNAQKHLAENYLNHSDKHTVINETETAEERARSLDMLIAGNPEIAEAARKIFDLTLPAGDFKRVDTDIT